jgi:hypothetical protein
VNPKMLTVLMREFRILAPVKLIYFPPESSMLEAQMAADCSVAIQSTAICILPCVAIRKFSNVDGSS